MLGAQTKTHVLLTEDQLEDEDEYKELSSRVFSMRAVLLCECGNYGEPNAMVWAHVLKYNRRIYLYKCPLPTSVMQNKELLLLALDRGWSGTIGGPHSRDTDVAAKLVQKYKAVDEINYPTSKEWLEAWVPKYAPFFFALPIERRDSIALDFVCNYQHVGLCISTHSGEQTFSDFIASVSPHLHQKLRAARAFRWPTMPCGEFADLAAVARLCYQDRSMGPRKANVAQIRAMSLGDLFSACSTACEAPSIALRRGWNNEPDDALVHRVAHIFWLELKRNKVGVRGYKDEYISFLSTNLCSADQDKFEKYIKSEVKKRDFAAFAEDLELVGFTTQRRR